MSSQTSPGPASNETQSKYLPTGNDPDFYFPVRARRRNGFWTTLRSLFQRRPSP